MNKHLLFSLFISLLIEHAIAQNFELVPITIKERENKTLLYQYTSNSDGFIGSNLYLYADSSFSLESFTDLADWKSEGLWTIKNDTFKLESEIQNELSIKVTYLDKPIDNKIRKFAIIRDLGNIEYPHGAIFINNDSVSCFYGDLECFGSYSKIDSIKVRVNEFSSPWIKVDSKKGIIQVVLQTKIDLTKYFSVAKQFKRKENTLLLLKE